MTDIFRLNKWFYLPYVFFLLIGGIVLIAFTKVESHWFFNQYNCLAADWFFKFFTHLGDGVVLAFFIPLLLFIRYREAIALSISSILVIILVQLFKRYIIPDVDRPLLVFESINQLHLVKGVTVHIAHSFPSGHSATSFSIFIIMAFLTKSNYYKMVFFFLSLLVGYSRIYLSQHFLVDVYFGSIIGVFSSTLIYWWVKNWRSTRFDLSLRNLFKSEKNVEIQ